MGGSRRQRSRWAGAAAALAVTVGAALVTVAGPASAATDLALGRAATSDTAQAAHPAAHGNDNSATTRWCAANAGTGHWWQVDLGGAVDLGGSQVVWEFARNYRYQIAVSTDGVAFTTVADRSANAGTAQTQADTFTARGRYVRITVTGLPAGTWASFYSFSVYGAGTVPDPTPTTPAPTTPGPTTPPPPPTGKPRIAVLTDIANEPDDEESLVRFLVYANEFDVEALIATTSRHLRTGPREDLIRRQLDAYERVRPNLVKHASGYPTAADLRGVTSTGQTAYGLAATGAGRSTAGSRRLIAAVDRADSRPLWVSVWGGANTLAQALYDVRATRTAAQLAAFVAKLRVYTVSDQDDTGIWLRNQFPGLFYIVSPGTNYATATWSGISGDTHYNNGPGFAFNLVQNSWLNPNVRQGHGPLGALYPAVKYIMEGDTPAWFGLVDNGLGWAVSPSYGGWGGRYAVSRPSSETRDIWTNSRDTVTYNGVAYTSAQATVWRWRDDYQYDFAARMDWNVADTYAKANHNPVPALNGDRSRNVVRLRAGSGATVELSAAGTTDPDGNPVTLRWWVYTEAGTLTGATLSAATGTTTTLRLPQTTRAGTVHVILEAEDGGTPRLTSYRRVVVDVTP